MCFEVASFIAISIVISITISCDTSFKSCDVSAYGNKQWRNRKKRTINL